MDVAIVTGADTRFGDAVCRTLLKMGFRIHALGQNPDVTGYDERFFIPHPYGAGRLAELKAALEEAIAAEPRVDLLVGLGGPEVVTGWEENAPEALVRRLHGCLTEPLLAASVCLKALLKSKGFLIHGHRRPVDKDLRVFPGYFEGAMKKAYDDLFVRHAAAGLRSARVLYAYPEDESEESSVHQDVAESVSRAFEIILRQKETCVVQEISLMPRGLRVSEFFPNLAAAVDPYQTTVLPEGESETSEPILIPTERPKHYVQIAEVKDITDGDHPVDDYYQDEQDDELDSPPARTPYPEDSEPSQEKSSKPRRRRSRGRSRRPRTEKGDKPEGAESSQRESPERKKEDRSGESSGEKTGAAMPENRDDQAPEKAPTKTGEDTEQKPPRKRPARKSTRKRAAPARKKATVRKTLPKKESDGEPAEAAPPPPPPDDQE